MRNFFNFSIFFIFILAVLAACTKRKRDAVNTSPKKSSLKIDSPEISIGKIENIQTLGQNSLYFNFDFKDAKYIEFYICSIEDKKM